MTSTSEKRSEDFKIQKTKHFKALAKKEHSWAISDHIKATRLNIKWDHHFEILALRKN